MAIDLRKQKPLLGKVLVFTTRKKLRKRIKRSC